MAAFVWEYLLNHSRCCALLKPGYHKYSLLRKGGRNLCSIGSMCIPTHNTMWCAAVLVSCRWCPDLRAVKLHTADPEERKRLKREVCMLTHTCTHRCSHLLAKLHQTCMQSRITPACSAAPTCIMNHTATALSLCCVKLAVCARMHSPAVQLCTAG